MSGGLAALAIQAATEVSALKQAYHAVACVRNLFRHKDCAEAMVTSAASKR